MFRLLALFAFTMALVYAAAMVAHGHYCKTESRDSIACRARNH